ncbi:hypothetical protein [Streptomyces ipomoeae]|uniref:hypothetical protein n=1 Tax=Streptomyces ipomoeae TaxID=103232 RepID=UPI001FD32B92|nr:hypothetical protein [Streptomyces ipomoeae]MDX2936668.1 hypothetical protein [Streptomyces ipomoeae]
MSTGTGADNGSGEAPLSGHSDPRAPHRTPGGLQGLPRRTPGAPSAPRPGEEPTQALRDRESGKDGGGDDAEDTLRPEALARAMTAIHRGSMRARLADPDDTGGRPSTPVRGTGIG